jgi:hypothetical protein
MIGARDAQATETPVKLHVVTTLGDVIVAINWLFSAPVGVMVFGYGYIV